MGILAKVGVTTTKTSTGTQATTGIGFDPKVLIPFGASMTADGATTTGMFGLGAADGTSVAACAVGAKNAVTTSVTNRRHTNADLWSPITADGVNYQNVALSSFDADGFTLNYTVTSATAYLLNHLCLGGDIEANLIQIQSPTSTGTQNYAHGLSKPPTALIGFGVRNQLAPPNTPTHAALSCGLWADGGQYVASVFAASAATTTICKRRAATSGFHWHPNNTGVTTYLESSVVSVDASDFSMNWTTVQPGDSFYAWILAITGCRAQVGTFDFSLSREIACAGISPKAILTAGISGAASGTVIDSAYMTLGASDGTTTVCSGITDGHGLTTTNARRWQDSDQYRVYSAGGTARGSGSYSFSDGLVSMSQDTTWNSGYGSGGYLILGDAIPASSGYGYGRAAYGYPGAYGG